MSRTIAIALLAGTLTSMAVAAPQRQLVVPFLNPGLRTVPVAPPPSYAPTASCEKQVVDGKVADLTRMRAGTPGRDAAPTVAPTSSPGFTGAGNVAACNPSVATPAPVATSLPLDSSTTSAVLDAAR